MVEKLLKYARQRAQTADTTNYLVLKLILHFFTTFLKFFYCQFTTYFRTVVYSFHFTTALLRSLLFYLTVPTIEQLPHSPTCLLTLPLASCVTSSDANRIQFGLPGKNGFPELLLSAGMPIVVVGLFACVTCPFSIIESRGQILWVVGDQWGESSTECAIRIGFSSTIHMQCVCLSMLTQLISVYILTEIT